MIHRLHPTSKDFYRAYAVCAASPSGDFTAYGQLLSDTLPYVEQRIISRLGGSTNLDKAKLDNAVCLVIDVWIRHLKNLESLQTNVKCKAGIKSIRGIFHARRRAIENRNRHR